VSDVRAYRWLAERRLTLIVALSLVFVVAHFAATLALAREDGLLRGDSRRYYVYLPSLLLDHDLDFSNDFALVYGQDPETADFSELGLTDTGLLGNVAPVGCAIFWAPFFLVALVFQAAAAVFGWGPGWHGYGYLAQASALIAGIFYGGAATWLTARILDRWFRPAVATGSAITVWLAGSALYYTAVSPAYSHTTAWFVVAMALYFWLEARERDSWAAAWPLWVASGVSFGLAAAVRQQDVFFVIAPMVDLLWYDKTAPTWPWAVRFKASALLGAATLLGFLPQMVIWRALYGGYLVSPMGAMDVAWTLPDVIETLFSVGFIGLFTWTPVAAVGTLGAFVFARQRPRLGIGLLVVLLLSIYYQAVIYDFQLGTSFGARRFISANVVFAAGLATLWSALLPQRPKLPLLIGGVLIAWNSILLIGYELLVHVHGFHPPLKSIVRWLFTGYSEPPF